MRCVLYLDDLLIMQQDREVLVEHTATVVHLLEASGFLVNYPKSHLEPLQILNFLGFMVDSLKRELRLPLEKVTTREARPLEANFKGKIRECQKTRSTAGENVSCSVGSTTCPTPLQGTLAPQAHGTEGRRLRYDGKGIAESKRRPDMVNEQSRSVEREEVGSCNTRNNNRDGCIVLRLGSVFPGGEYRGLLGPTGKSFSHQRSGDAGSILCSEGIFEVPAGSVCFDPIGQSECCGPYKQVGWHEIRRPDSTDKENPEVVSGQKYSVGGLTYSRQIECNSRFPVKVRKEQDRLDTKSGYLCGTEQDLGTSTGRSVCQQVLSSAPDVFQLESGSRSGSNRCVQSTLVSDPGICTPTMVPHNESASQGTDGESNSGGDCPVMEDTGVVSGDDGDVNGSSDYSARSRRCGNSISKLRMSSSAGHTTIGRMEGLRRQFQEKAISGKASELILASWRQKTNSNYNSSWRKWEEWCASSNVHPFSSGISEVLDGKP